MKGGRKRTLRTLAQKEVREGSSNVEHEGGERKGKTGLGQTWEASPMVHRGKVTWSPKGE